MYSPQHPLLSTGLAHQGQGDWQAAAACYHAAAEAAPIESRFLLGWLACEQGDHAGAKARLDAVLALDPAFAPALVLRGQLALGEGAFARAVALLQQAIAQGADPAVQRFLAEALVVLGRYREAIDALSACLQAYPDDVYARKLLAGAQKASGLPFQAARSLEQVLLRTPHDLDAYARLDHVWALIGQRDGQKRYYERVLRLSPQGAAWHDALPPAARSQLAAQRRTLEFLYLLLCYTDPEVDDQALFDLVDRLTPVELNDASELNGQTEVNGQTDVNEPIAAIGLVSGSIQFTGAEPISGRRLRVGYFSREFGLYSSLQLVRPLFRHHGPGVELFAYNDTHQLNWTRASEEFKAYFAHWRDTAGLDNAAVADLMRRDRLDVLVDLAGVSDESRHGVYAFRPARVSVSGLGFVFSACHAHMDYCFSDERLAPPAIAARYPETVVTLRSAFHWDPPEPLPLGAPPCLARAYVTFGSANTLNKLNPRVIRLWAELLKRLPGARLFLKNHTLGDELNQRFWCALFAHHGVDPDRLQFAGQTHEPHLSAFYPQIDIALDPFPYQGGVTTCDALWMGVPVVSLLHEPWRARALGAHILASTGLEAWLAHSEAEYLERALAWAADPDFLASQRLTLRSRLLDSPICDGPAAAAEVEAAFRWMLARQDQKTTRER